MALFAEPTAAATLTWGTSGTGGGGTWDTSTSNWSNGGNTTWNNANNGDAWFTGTPGTVTLTTSNTAKSLTFDNSSGLYTIALNSQTLAIGGGGITRNATSGSATISGPGTVLLTTWQTWTNNSTAGLLTVSSRVNMNGYNLTVTGSGSTLISGTIISGAGVLWKEGAGTLELSASGNYLDRVRVNGGTLLVTGGTFASAASVFATLQIGNGGTTGSIADGDPVSVYSGAVLAFNRSDALTYGGTVSGAGGLTNLGSGTVTLSAANTYTGATTISNGVLQVGNGGTSGSIANGSPVSVSSGAVLAFNRSDSFTYGGTVSGAGGLAKLGSGTVTLSAASTYTGTTKVSAGVLQVGTGGTTGSISNSSPVTVLAGATLAFNGSDALTYGGTISGAGGLTKLGAGTLTLSAANAYGGPTTISGGTIQAGSATALGTGAVAINAGGLDLNGKALAIGMLSGSSGASVTSSVAGAASLKTSFSGESTFAGVISNGLGTVGFEKAGIGKLTLTAVQTYTGATIISGGTLALGSAGSFANSREIVVGNAGSSGAVLDLTDKASVAIDVGQTLEGIGTALLGPMTALTVSGTFSPGNSPGLFTYDGGSTTLAGTTLMEIWGTSRGVNPGYDAVDVKNNGLLTFGGALVFDFSQTFSENDTFLLFQGLSGGSLAGTFGSYSITGSSDYTGLTFAQVGTSNVWRTGQTLGGQALELTYGSNALTLSVVPAVPEPGTLALAGCGLGFIGWRAWRRRNGRHA